MNWGSLKVSGLDTHTQRLRIWCEAVPEHPPICCSPPNPGKVKSLSCVRLFATPWTVAYQASLSVGFSRQEYRSGLPFPSLGNLPDPGIEPGSPALQADALPAEPPGKPSNSEATVYIRKELGYQRPSLGNPLRNCLSLEAGRAFIKPKRQKNPAHGLQSRREWL